MWGVMQESVHEQKSLRCWQVEEWEWLKNGSGWRMGVVEGKRWIFWAQTVQAQTVKTQTVNNCCFSGLYWWDKHFICGLRTWMTVISTSVCVCRADTLPPLLGKGFPILSTEHWPRNWSRCTGSQPQVTVSHPPGSRLPLLSVRPAVTSPAAEHHRPLAGTKLYCLVIETHRCEQLA